jgi:S-adenosylmethionine/arginine decarboxylase-like enzyme
MTKGIYVKEDDQDWGSAGMNDVQQPVEVLVHKHLIVRAEAINPPMNEEFLTKWLHDFIKYINMKVLMGPYVIYHDVPGNRGITGAAIIETSHIVMHVWDEPSPALMQFDVYSCGEFDPERICRMIQRDFDVTKIDYKFLDRENDLTDVSGGFHVYKDRLKDLIAQNHNAKEKEAKEKLLLKNRKEVDINKDGSGYTIKEGPNKGKVLAHIQIPSKNL